MGSGRRAASAPAQFLGNLAATRAGVEVREPQPRGACGYAGGMDSKDLTERQAEVLRNRVGRMLGYVGRMMKRMQVRGWPPDDPVYERTRNAERVLYDLHVRLIYLAAPAGTAGRRAPLEGRRPWDPGRSGRRRPGAD